MTYIPESLRRLVRERAGYCCEYCLLSESDNFFSHEIDHIIAEKHSGKTEADNLCLSCFDCNRHKGSDIGSIDQTSGTFVALFHPRQDRWDEHFRLNEGYIEPLSAQGRVTVSVLNMNRDVQVAKRQQLIALALYPCRTNQ